MCVCLCVCVCVCALRRCQWFCEEALEVGDPDTGAVNNVLEHSRAGEHWKVRQSLVDGGVSSSSFD